MAKPQDTKPAKGGGFLSGILALLIITGLGVGAGGLFGLQAAQRLGPSAQKNSPVPAHDAHGGKDAGHGKDAHGKDGHGKDAKDAKVVGPRLIPLPNLVTNLAAPDKVWIRIEGSVVVEGENGEKLAGAVAEDIVKYLRTVTLEQLQGGSGYQYLREDLNERVRVRGQGKVRDFVLQSFIVE